MDLTKLYNAFKECSSVSIDTRTIEEHAMFFAIKGEHFDGNKFASSAIEKGAKYAVVNDASLKGDQFIFVQDTLDALQKVANFHRNTLKDTTFIALTGSNGKTTTKELIAHFLSQKYHVQYTKGNYNNHLGVPLTLLSIQESTEIAVIEMGANHVGEIKALCEIAEPDCGLITNIGKAHIGEFGSQENIFKGKTELYDFLKSRNQLIFYDTKSSWLPGALEGYHNTYSYAKGISTFDFEFLGFKPKIEGKIKNENVSIDLGGMHNVQNVECAVAVSGYFGLDPKQLIQAFNCFAAPENRSQWKRTDRNTLFLDAYNSNPSSMEAAIRYFDSFEAKNKVIIVGEMLELGSFSDVEHLRLCQLLKSIGIEFYAVGQGFAHINEDYVYKDISSFLDATTLSSWKNRTILLKGSRGMKMEQLVSHL